MQRRNTILCAVGTLILVATGCADHSKDGDSGSLDTSGATNDKKPENGGSNAPPGNPPTSTVPAETRPVTKTFAEVGIVPFDVDKQDLVGPNDWNTKYGMLPQIVAAPGDGFIDIALRQTDGSAPAKTVVVRLESDADGTWRMARHIELKSLGTLLGFARAADGSYYYATGSNDPNVTKTFPAPKQHRTDIVRVMRFDADARTAFDVDLDMARAAATPDCESIISPGTASSARLAVAGNVVGLVHGTATDPDGGGTRHQKALSTFLDKDTGAIRQTGSIWVSHSFDQRQLVDGSDLYEVHLGDAFPRSVVTTRVHDAAAGSDHKVYRMKGGTGENNTYTRLGGTVRIDAGPAAGSFLTLVATERTTETGDGEVHGSRDLALVRLTPALANGSSDDVVDASFGTASTVQSGGEEATNHLLYLTNYHTSAALKTHAERPKIVALGGGEFIVLFERWTLGGGDAQTFDGTFAMRIDGNGAISAGPTRVSQHHLPRGDDAFAYGKDATWISGNETTHALTVHRVTRDLTVSEKEIP